MRAQIVVENSAKEGRHACRAISFVPVPIDDMSVVLVRALNAGVTGPNGTCAESVVVERIGLVC